MKYHFGPVGPAAAGPVPGGQTAQHRVLFAAYMALLAHGGRVCVVTDSQYVARGVCQLAGRPRPPEWAHADIWAALRRAAAPRHVGSLLTARSPSLPSCRSRMGGATPRPTGSPAKRLPRRSHPCTCCRPPSRQRRTTRRRSPWGLQRSRRSSPGLTRAIAHGPTRFPRKRARFQARPRPRLYPADAAPSRPRPRRDLPPGAMTWRWSCLQALRYCVRAMHQGAACARPTGGLGVLRLRA